MSKLSRSIGGWILLASITVLGAALQVQPNYDESKVPQYQLPDPLQFSDGSPVTSADQWFLRRRSQLLRLFENEVYGRSPERPRKLEYKVVSNDRQAMGGRATRRQVQISLTGYPEGPALNLLIYLPNSAAGRVPVFLGLNFRGNHSINSDPGILLSEAWMPDDPDGGIVEHRATEQSRGSRSGRWPVSLILEKGFALATAYYGDLDPDFDDGFQNGVHRLYYRFGQKALTNEDWGSISAWAWGLSLAMDYLQKDSDIDRRKVSVMGHSRLGKTALWAGAQDQRFALVVSNNSGCGGAALSRRRFGETVESINTAFPHWFCANFKKYNQLEETLPVDQHMLLALIAPRPLYVASAEEDRWADPRGEYLAAKAADPVYRLLGTDGLGSPEMPPVNQPVMTRIGYHIRSGQHDVTDYDWNQYLAFAERHLLHRQ